MLDYTRYRLRLIQLCILCRLNRGLLTPELSHSIAVLCINLTIFLLTLGMCSKTNHLLGQYLYTISGILLLIRCTSIGLKKLHLILPHELDLLLILFVLRVRLMYCQYLLLLGLCQSYQSASILVVLG